MTTEKLWSVTEAADFLGLTDVRVRQFCREGRLGSKVGAYYVIPDEQLQEFSRKKRKPGNPSQGRKKTA